jgi:hypothetical protein
VSFDYPASKGEKPKRRKKNPVKWAFSSGELKKIPHFRIWRYFEHGILHIPNTKNRWIFINYFLSYQKLFYAGMKSIIFASQGFLIPCSPAHRRRSETLGKSISCSAVMSYTEWKCNDQSFKTSNSERDHQFMGGIAALSGKKTPTPFSQMNNWSLFLQPKMTISFTNCTYCIAAY